VTVEKTVEGPGTRDEITEDLVAALLFAVASAMSTHSVRKTTLAALLDAIEESPDGQDAYLDVLAHANLTDALLALRERGRVQLTDQGFALSDQYEPRLWPSVSGWFSPLVGRKLSEWRLGPAPV